MIRRRGAIPILLLVFLVLFGTAAQVLRGPAAAPNAAVPAAPAPTRPVAPTPQARAVVRSLDAVRRAFNAGNVQRLCRAGALVDPAVIRRQNRRAGGCEAELEGLIANEPRMRLTVRRLALRRDLATATVATARGTGVQVDLVRQGRRWLLSFSGSSDPMPALAAGV